MLSVVMPKVVVIAGPNGAGKSTAAPAVLRTAELCRFSEWKYELKIRVSVVRFRPWPHALSASIQFA
jgi:ABC-type hemin transport system ATPase subunit